MSLYMALEEFSRLCAMFIKFNQDHMSPCLLFLFENCVQMLLLDLGCVWRVVLVSKLPR
jgi:hypothetical protein